MEDFSSASYVGRKRQAKSWERFRKAQEAKKAATPSPASSGSWSIDRGVQVKTAVKAPSVPKIITPTVTKPVKVNINVPAAKASGAPLKRPADPSAKQWKPVDVGAQLRQRNRPLGWRPPLDVPHRDPRASTPAATKSSRAGIIDSAVGKIAIAAGTAIAGAALLRKGAKQPDPEIRAAKAAVGKKPVPKPALSMADIKMPAGKPTPISAIKAPAAAKPAKVKMSVQLDQDMKKFEQKLDNNPKLYTPAELTEIHERRAGERRVSPTDQFNAERREGARRAKTVKQAVTPAAPAAVAAPAPKKGGRKKGGKKASVNERVDAQIAANEKRIAELVAAGADKVKPAVVPATTPAAPTVAQAPKAQAVVKPRNPATVIKAAIAKGETIESAVASLTPRETEKLKSGVRIMQKHEEYEAKKAPAIKPARNLEQNKSAYEAVRRAIATGEGVEEALVNLPAGTKKSEKLKAQAAASVKIPAVIAVKPAAASTPPETPSVQQALDTSTMTREEKDARIKANKARIKEIKAARRKGTAGTPPIPPVPPESPGAVSQALAIEKAQTPPKPKTVGEPGVLMVTSIKPPTAAKAAKEQKAILKKVRQENKVEKGIEAAKGTFENKPQPTAGKDARTASQITGISEADLSRIGRERVARIEAERAKALEAAPIKQAVEPKTVESKFGTTPEAVAEVANVDDKLPEAPANRAREASRAYLSLGPEERALVDRIDDLERAEGDRRSGDRRSQDISVADEQRAGERRAGRGYPVGQGVAAEGDYEVKQAVGTQAKIMRSSIYRGTEVPFITDIPGAIKKHQEMLARKRKATVRAEGLRGSAEADLTPEGIAKEEARRKAYVAEVARRQEVQKETYRRSRLARGLPPVKGYNPNLPPLQQPKGFPPLEKQLAFEKKERLSRAGARGRIDARVMGGQVPDLTAEHPKLGPGRGLRPPKGRPGFVQREGPPKTTTVAFAEGAKQLWETVEEQAKRRFERFTGMHPKKAQPPLTNPSIGLHVGNNINKAAVKAQVKAAIKGTGKVGAVLTTLFAGAEAAKAAALTDGPAQLRLAAARKAAQDAGLETAKGVAAWTAAGLAASKVPGVAGVAARFGLNTIIPGAAIVTGGYQIGSMFGREAGKISSAQAEAEAQAQTSSDLYGTPEKAAQTRRFRRGGMTIDEAANILDSQKAREHVVAALAKQRPKDLLTGE